MERADAEKSASEDGPQLNRNRSFKTKQLVRSQAIRETQSPPRALTPSPAPLDDTNVTNSVTQNNVTNNVNKNSVNTNANVTKNNVTKNSVTKNNVTKNSVNNNVKSNVNNNVATTEAGDVRSECHNDECGKESFEDKKQTVEIQITGREWEPAPTEQRHRARRWLHKHHSEPTRDLLSNHPRVSCVCGACANCPYCRGRRRRHICTIKQDSGIACSDDCPDCLDTDTTGPDGYRKSESLEHIYYCRCPERKEKPKYISLSRMDSEERLEPTGPELVAFIKEVLNKDARDRQTVLKIERELHALVSDSGRCIVRFPVMTSYGRMLVHRCASLFQLAHHLDQANKNSVLVSKSGTSGGRIPCTSFRQWCVVTFPPAPPPPAPDTRAKSILKRDTNSLDEPGSGALANSRSKSLEQRERDYERMKRRIFTEDNCTQDESQWPWLNSGPVKLLTPDTARNKLVKVQSLESGPTPNSGRGVVSKSHSFGGYGGHEQPHPRLLSRQGDLASSSWRLSPSSSGYKTLSLRSTDSVTPSPTGGASPEPGALPGAVVCAVTDMGCVPPGALLINPQTGRPLTNPDGSLYHFDPAHPPVYDCNVYQHDKIDQSNEKKRGKLEKQHSFIDHECECPPADDSRAKCCCACARQDPGDRNSEKITVDQQPPDQASPTKSRYEQTDPPPESNIYDVQNDDIPPEVVEYDPTKTQPYLQDDTTYEAGYENFGTDLTVYEAATNQIPPFEPATNQRQDSEVVNARIGKLTNQDSQEFYTQQPYGYIRNDEVASPQSQHGNHGYPQVEMGVQAMAQAKVTPVQFPDPHLRPVSLTNMSSYPTAVHQGYSPYQYRIEQSLQSVYHHGQLVATTEDHKATTSPQQEPTFRIDPSYPYAALDFSAQCGAYVDPNTMRSYSLPYGQVEPPQYPLANVMLPPPPLQHYQYQDVQWQQPPLLPAPKLVVPELYPVYPGVYPYNLLYPQVIPQPYPMCQPVYGVVEKSPSRSNSAASASANMHANAVASAFANAHVEHSDGDNRAPSTHSIDNNINVRNSNEIAAKIQMIKEQMAQLHTHDPRANNNNNNNSNSYNNNYNYRRDDFRRRNNGHGILGSYPHTRMQRPPHDETQLSSAARAIVNSIRNMQVKNNYQDRREFQYRVDRSDYRRRPERDGDRLERDNYDRDNRARNIPFQYRPPHLLRQMSPGTWCRRSPGPVHPVMNHPRRPHPDAKNNRR